MRRFIMSLTALAVAAGGTVWTATGAVAMGPGQDTGRPMVTVCALRADPFPAFGAGDEPGNLYGIMATGVGCSLAKRVARAAIRKTNPGPGKSFTGPGAFSLCISKTPSSATKVFAGSCVKPGSTPKIVIWIPTCGDGPCKGLPKVSG